MKLKLFTFLLAAFLPVLSFGQGAALTIFSEDGDPFILYLNGTQQNVKPQANLRLDNLTQPYYQARIVFADKAKGEIQKNVPVNDPGTNTPADVVYKIKNKDGEMKLRYFSAQPVQPNYTPPANVYVVHYGQPDPGTTVTQTTVTTTTNTGNGGGGSVGITPVGGNGGVNINMNMSFGDPNTTQTTTTTTTTSSYSSTTTNSGYSAQPAATGCQFPMDAGSFRSAKETLNSSNFDDTKFSSAQSILSSNCVSTDQVIELCGLFSFEETKLKFAKYAYGKTTDPNNYFKVVNTFTYESSKTDLNNYISSGGR